jgi:hypothetical protein
MIKGTLTFDHALFVKFAFGRIQLAQRAPPLDGSCPIFGIRNLLKIQHDWRPPPIRTPQA